jgi:tetratricopeptide (TPR) repeat protein
MRGPGERTFMRAALCAMVFVAAGSAWQAAEPAQVAAAQPDLSYSSNATWTADPADSRVNVFAVFSATSHAVDTPGRHYFYSSLELTLPASSTAFVATSAEGDPLPVAVRATYATGIVVEVGFGQRLYAGETATFDLSFQIVDRGGSTDRDLRIGRNLVSFPVSAFGSPGQPGGSVTVVFPPGFSVQEEYGGLTRSLAGDGTAVYTTGPLDDPTELEAWFTAVEPVPQSGFSTRAIVVGPLHVTLSYWADDPGWADQVERVLRSGYPMLSDMIGVGDPIGTSLTVQESTNQEIGGFSGSFEELSGRVQVSYYADPFVILHETAHLWFNGTMATDRWIDEGFASYYAEQVVQRLGLPDHSPRLSGPLLAAASPLDVWVNAGQPDSAADAYLYGASLETARQIAGLAGLGGLSRVWSQIRAGAWAYQPTHSATEIGRIGGLDSRSFLDYLEQTTGRSYGAIWQQWVMSGPQAEVLQRRSGARTAYRDAQATAGAWDLPPDIRRTMDTWQFDEAIAFMGQARTTLATAAQIATQSVQEGTTVPGNLKSAFEAGLVRGTDEANAELAALRSMEGARQAEADQHGAARGLGLLGADPGADLDRARAAFSAGNIPAAQAFASEAWSEWAGAAGAGEIRILGATLGGAGVLLLLAVLIWTKGGKRKPELAAAAAAAVGSISAGATKAAEGAAAVGSVVSDSVASGGVARAPELASLSPDAWICPAGANSDLPPLESVYELLQRGHALLRDQHNAQAAVVLERAARLEPGKASIVEALGRAYYNSGQHARAAEAFDALLEIDPSAHYGHFGLGLSLERLGQDLEARTHLRLAAAMDPANPAYRRALDRIEAALV